MEGVYLKNIKKYFDNIIDFISIFFVALLVIIISYQVFTRNVLNYTPKWSEEASLLLLVWITFCGIGVGFREKLHIGVGFLVALFPKKTRYFFDLISQILLIIVSILFIVYGYKFTLLMNNSTMPGTGFPQSILYAAVPVSGILMLIYGIELLVKKEMHKETDEISKE